MWKADYSTPILTFMGHSSPVNTLLLNSEEAELYSGLRGGMIVLWDILNQKVKINLKGHSTQITSMTLFQKKSAENILVSGSADGKIKLWDLKSKIPATNIKGHFSQIDALSFSPDFAYLASGAQDGIVKLWDIRNTNKVLKEIYEGDQKAINCIEFNNDMKLAFGGKDKVIRFYNLEKFGKIGQTCPDRLPIQKIAFDNDGKNIISATDESLKYWEINEHGLNLIDMFESGWNKLQSFKYLQGKAVCALGSFGNKISYYILKYQDLVQSPNLILRENPFTPNIPEVKETEDNSNLDSKTEKIDNNIMNGTEIIISNNLNNKKNINEKETEIINDMENINGNNNLGISKFINKDDINNIDISLTEVSTSKMENQNNNNILKTDIYDITGEQKNSKINEIKINSKENNINNDNNNNYIIDEDIDKIMLGDISNMSDISDNKGDLTLGMIVGDHKTNDEISDIKIKIKNKNNEKKDIKNEFNAFSEFGEKDIEQFLGNNFEKNKNLDVSELPSFIGDNEFNAFNDLSIITSNKQSYPSNISKTESNNNKNNKTLNNDNKTKKLTLNDLSKIDYASMINNGNKDNNNNFQNINTNNTLIDNKSFVSLKSNETLGIDITQLIAENGMITESKSKISTSEDLPILHEINSQHDNMRTTISKRFNGLKIVTEWWKKSDIPSTLNALRILKDYSVVKDFFYYAIISREDITKIPLTLDSAIVMLPYVYILMKSKVDVYWKTACRAGMTFLKIYMEKIENTMKNKKYAVGIEDKILEERVKKCEEIVKIFRQIYESNFLRQHITIKNNNNTIKENSSDNINIDNENNLAYAFFTDLQFFLNNYENSNKIIINNI